MAGKEPQPTSVGVKLPAPGQRPSTPSSASKNIASIPKTPGTDKRSK